MNRLLFLVILLVMIVSVSGCNKLRKSWVKEGYKGQYYSMMAVVDLSPDLEERADLEAYAVGLLVRNNINSIGGMTIFPQGQKESGIEASIAKNKLDGILTISLVRVEEAGILPEDYNQFSKFYHHRFTQLNTQNYLINGEKYVMEALLYNLTLEGESNNLVWRGEMAVLDPNKIETKYRFMRRVVDQLIKEELVLISKDQSSFEAGLITTKTPRTQNITSLHL